MKYLYGQDCIEQVLENVEDIKYIRQKDKLYKIFIQNGNLVVSIYDENAKFLHDTHIADTSIKGDFDAYCDIFGRLHIASVSRKFGLNYIVFNGTSWSKEEIYSYRDSVGIPCTPKITTYENICYIAVHFIRFGESKSWSIRSFIKSNNLWHSKIIDKGRQLCYTQPSFIVDKAGNAHLVYRFHEKDSNIKYSFYSRARNEWNVSKIIQKDNADKYRPFVFENRIGKIYICWIEIERDIFQLCVLNKGLDNSLMKMNISEKIQDMFIYSSSDHIRCGSLTELMTQYDLCCRKKVEDELKLSIDDYQEGGNQMNINVRLFLDIKRELESQIAQLQEKFRNLNEELGEKSENITKEYENIKLQKEQKELEVVQLSNDYRNVLLENEELRNDLEELQKRLIQVGKQKISEVNNFKEASVEKKPQLYKRLFGFLKKDA